MTIKEMASLEAENYGWSKAQGFEVEILLENHDLLWRTSTSV